MNSFSGKTPKIPEIFDQLKPDGRGCKALGRFFVLASYAWLST
jgi:hypothetical protein